METDDILKYIRHERGRNIMIEYLYINNYKSFVNFRMDFNKSNLLIGQNGTGKSNVFVVIAAIRDIINGVSNTINECFSQETITRWMKSNIQTFEMGLKDRDFGYMYRLEIEHDASSTNTRILSERVLCDGDIIYQMSNGNAEVYDDDHNIGRVLADSNTSGIAFVPMDNRHRKIKGFREQIARIILCTPNPKAMPDIVQNDIYVPKIDFSNIASTFAGVVLTDPDIYSDLADTFRGISPGFYKARISVDQFFKRLILDYNHNGTSCSYYFSELSDGERMLFALYTLLYGFIKKGKIVLLDEPDNYLSLTEIQPWCINMEKELAEDGQCIMISHHPEIIDYMAETDGIWMSRLSSGDSKITSGPNIGDNKDLLTYSEMITRGLLDEA